ncbi:hypothetical protein D6D02_04521 [Aureobasidium pullulans]|nr:hypothetical protein D6D26_03142 [Aureobasidium pullulans]THW60655.1 hypothetical protein D6D25_02541 [Aureobasidium pullulans]THX94547.1 hypothetical protein D6D03_09608 [Aureobasidium pullulans]THY13895.1 hypothetical protein D6D02_04521 [Aureobasidium pullulans]
MIYNGSCHCGTVKIQLEAESVTKAICHCLDCKTKTWSYTSDSGKDYIVNFCGDCGSTLFGEPTRLPDVVSIKAGCLDNSGTNLGSMDAEVFVERRVDYLKPFEGMKQIVGMI